MKKLPEGEKYFFFFFNFYFTFSLSSDRKNENYLLFPPFLIPQIEKPHGKTCMKIFFFFFYFFSLPLLVIEKNYHLPFFPKFRGKSAQKSRCTLKFHFLQITFFPPSSREHTHTHCVLRTHNA